MADDLIGAEGIAVTSASLQAGLARQAQARADETRDAWIGHESELARFQLEDVMDAAHHTAR
jgi:hypothetical protein